MPAPGLTDLESIAERVRLGVHYLDRNPDEERDWMPFFGGLVSGPDPHYSHSPWDACDMGWRMVEAYILARQVLGQSEPGPAERRLRRFVLSTLRDDGLSYRPLTSWCANEAWMWDHGRALIALSTWLRLEPCDEIAGVARRMVRGLAAISVKEGGFWVHPSENWQGTGWGDAVFAHPPTGLAIEGLVDLAGLLGDEEALEWAGHFARASLDRQPPLFADDGTLVPMGGGPHDFYFTHVHSRLGILTGLLKYALVERDDALRQWCTHAYGSARDQLSSSFGWVPESLERGSDPQVQHLSEFRRDEVCSICDMMGLASLLSVSGYPEERDTAWRYGVNQLFAHQLVSLEPFERLMRDPASGAATGSAADVPSSHRDMPERCKGGFTPGAYPADLVVNLQSFGMSPETVEVGGCCSMAGIKALYLLWRQAVQVEDDSLSIHLGVTAETDDVAVHCGEPAVGETEILLKRGCGSLSVRVPEPVEVAAVVADHPLHRDERHLSLGEVGAGERVRLTYPLAERSSVESIDDVPYRVAWRGGRVMDIDPVGAGCSPYWWRSPGPA